MCYESTQILWSRLSRIVYKRALIIELKNLGVACVQEMEKDIIYDNKFIYKRRLDLLVEDVVLVELKALKEVD